MLETKTPISAKMILKKTDWSLVVDYANIMLKDYIESVVMSAVRKVDSLYHSVNFFSLQSILHIYIFPLFKYFCHILTGAFGINTLIVIILMNMSLCYLEVMNLSATP